MTDDGEVFEITPKGREVIEDITARFSAGEDIEQIAESYNTEVDLIRVLMAFDAILPIERKE